MELSLVLLLCLASYPLSHAVPILGTGAAVTDIITNAQVDNWTVSEIIQEVNKEIVINAEVNNGTMSEIIQTTSKDIINDPGEDIRTVSEIIKEVNKDVPFLLVEGDIRPHRSRSVNNCPSCLWQKSPDGIVRVPFIVSSAFTNFEITMFNTAMKEYEVMTCVQFVNRTTENDYLYIDSGSGCWSYVGKIRGAQTVSLSLGSSIKYNLIQHELMHNLGFYHEHTRSDRDKYINILWQNISPGYASIFYLDSGNTQNIPYDYNSIVHYNRYAFSAVSGQPSMVPKGDPTIPMGQAIGLSDLDVMRVNSIYNCNLCRKKFFPLGSFVYNSTTSGQLGNQCLYLIQSSVLVLLQLSNINIPSSPNCNNAYIKVYDGVSQSSPVLVQKTCGRGPVPPLTSSGNFILIEILNNQTSAPSTFTASYDTVRYGGTFVTNKGVVTSPDFPNLYPVNVTSVYSIVAPIGYKVSLTFSFFSTHTSLNCSIEYLTLIDGPLMTSPILAKYCGSVHIPTTVVSTGNTMVLQFQSAKGGHNGFYAPYTFVTVS